ncbi:hypothetical protein J2T60_002331 [Natronospira proteinivora]|uniref:Intracellular growth attenuator protein IgaA n=1 Tax=Natronospira proteinivora TaxID=1807133 RepID=A0ABT1GAI0_9GAMM|nr:hypothetical protein [Natronospira proteinivora]
MDGFVLIKIALFLIIAFVSIVSGINYQLRRRRSRRTAKRARQELPPLRQLDSRELEALQGQLNDPARPDRQLSLDNHQVYRLGGLFERHGLDAGGNTTWHDLIGGIEVILPYDAALSLREDNEAEVAFAGRYAVVVRLNDDFELGGAVERQRRREEQENQWEAGIRGPLKQVFQDGADTDDDRPRGTVRILSQRLESSAEVEDREGRGIGFLSGAVWLAAFIALAIAAVVEGETARQIWAIAGGVLGLLGLWLFWRPYRPGEPARVNRVEGPLDILFYENPNGGPNTGQPVLGNALPFTVPRHWFGKLGAQIGQRVEADIRVTDRTAVGLDPNFSIDAEMMQSPPRYWGRHLTLSLVAAGAFFALLANSPGPVGDVLQAHHALNGGELREYHDSPSLAESMPALGEMVSLAGQGHCQVETPSSNQVTGQIDCSRIRWDGDLLDEPIEPLPEYLQLLGGGDYLDTRDLTAMERMLVGGQTRGRDVRVIENPGRAVSLVQQVCGDEEANGQGRRSLLVHSCDQAQELLLSRMILDMEDAPEDWAGLSEAFNDDANDDVVGLILKRELDRFYRHGRELSNRITVDHREALAESILVHQGGGVLLEVQNAADAELPSYHFRNDGLGHWQALKRLTTDEGADDFAVEGLVMAAGVDDSGAPHLLLDASRSSDSSWPALMRSAALILAGLLLIIHLPLFVATLMAARRRRRTLRSEVNSDSML